MPDDMRETLESVMGRMRSEILPPLGIDGFTVFVADLHGDLGRYVDGTSSHPVIGIDHDRLAECYRLEGQDYVVRLAATLVHEIGRAHQETLDAEHPDEDAVEAFAHRWVTTGIVDVSILEALVAPKGIEPLFPA